MGDALVRRFFGGFVRLHILYHAEQEWICGVDMIAELGHHGYTLSPGTLYPVLHELENGGYLVLRKQVIGGKQRKNYRITPSGRKLLRQARAKLRELAGELLEDRPVGTTLRKLKKGRS
jgi:DNA-binding PadR family transcriptional regulator